MSSARINRAPLASAGGAATVDRLHSSRNLVPPTIDPDLIQYLREVFKVSLSPGMDYRLVDQMIGQQLVIEHLEAIAKEQAEN